MRASPCGRCWFIDLTSLGVEAGKTARPLEDLKTPVGIFMGIELTSAERSSSIIFLMKHDPAA